MACSFWFEIQAKINILCINHQNCDFGGPRDWQGRIVGKGIHGSLNALLTKIKHKNKLSKKDTPLMGLLTICIECCEGLGLHEDDLGQIPSSKDSKPLGSMVLSLSYKEVEEVVSSKVIIMEGMLMNTIKTVGVDAKEKKWPLLKPIFKN